MILFNFCKNCKHMYTTMNVFFLIIIADYSLKMNKSEILLAVLTILMKIIQYIWYSIKLITNN